MDKLTRIRTGLLFALAALVAACGGSPGQPSPTATVAVTGLERYPPAEQIVARTMYSRPRGNLDPDRDPSGAGVLFTEAAALRVRVTCDHVLGR